MSYDPNEMMLELFRAEVDSHSESLTSSLLKLEQDPTDKVLLDGIMRAAHSIKGAARIVRVDAAVEIAHVMEDCFVAAQRGELVLQPAGIDILLRSVDLLGQISDASKNPNVEWESFQPAISSAVSQLRNVLQGKPSIVSENPTPPIPIQNSIATDVHSRSIESHHAAIPSTVPVVESLRTDQEANIGPLIRRIVLPEKLDASNAESIRVQLLTALEESGNQGPVTIDLSKTKDLDSIGLALLHSATQFAERKKRQLEFAKPSLMLARILSAVGIESAGRRAESGSEGIRDDK